MIRILVSCCCKVKDFFYIRMLLNSKMSVRSSVRGTYELYTLCALVRKRFIMKG